MDGCLELLLNLFQIWGFNLILIFTLLVEKRKGKTIRITIVVVLLSIMLV